MTVSKEKARHAEAVSGQEAPFNPRVSAALTTLRQFIEQSQDSGHAAAPTDEQIFELAKRHGAFSADAQRGLILWEHMGDKQGLISFARAVLALSPPSLPGEAVQQPTAELLGEAHAQIRHIIDDLTDAVTDGGLTRYVPRQNLTFSNCIAALIPLADRMRAALSGAAPTPQPGWKLVPVEPTPEMIAAMALTPATMMDDGVPCIGMGGAEEAYAAMLGAAPTQAPQQPPDLRAVLQQVSSDKSFCCLKERTQGAVKSALAAGVPSSDGGQQQ